MNQTSGPSSMSRGRAIARAANLDQQCLTKLGDDLFSPKLSCRLSKLSEELTLLFEQLTSKALSLL